MVNVRWALSEPESAAPPLLLAALYEFSIEIRHFGMWSRNTAEDVHTRKKNTSSTTPMNPIGPSWTRASYSFSALTILLEAIATHSPDGVKPPPGRLMPGIGGDHVRLLISVAEGKTSMGSTTCFIGASGRGDVSPGVRDGARGGESTPLARSHIRTCESSPKMFR